MKRQYAKNVQFNDGVGTIHGFTTGMVSVKTKFREARGGALLSKLNFLLDSQFTEYMPIWVWVIDHPEGVFVIDTGENARVKNEGERLLSGRRYNLRSKTINSGRNGRRASGF